MITAPKFHGSLYRFEPDDASLGVVPVGQLITWKWGLRLVGVTRAGRPLSDGESDDTFLDCEWLQEWDNREGFQLIEADELSSYLFVRPDLEVVFVGPPASVHYGLYTRPEFVGVRSADIPPGMKGVLREPFFSCSAAALCAALEQGLDGIECSLKSNPKLDLLDRIVPFRPLRPLTPAEWKLLDHYVFTNEGETAVNAVPFIDPAAGPQFALPVEKVEELEAFGLAAAIRFATRTTPTQLIPREVIVYRPRAAENLASFLSFFPRGAMIEVLSGEKISPDHTCIDARELFELVRLPKVSRLLADAHGLLVVIPDDQIKLDGNWPIHGYKHDGSWLKSGFILATHESVENALVDASTAARLYRVPSDLKPSKVFVEGDPLPGHYYFHSQLEGLDSAATKRQQNIERKARLTALYGDKLPAKWKKWDDAQVAAIVRWHEAQDAGWLHVGYLADALGAIAKEGESLPPLVREALESWLTEVQWPVAEKTAEKEYSLYAPLTYDQAVEHEKFADLFVALSGPCKQFIMKSVFNEKARGALMLGAIAR